MSAVTASSPVSRRRAPIRLDSAVRVLDGGRLLVGGEPLRALRLSPAGARTLAELQQEPPATAAAERLAERLIDGGLAHPRPHPAAAPEVTVVVPVRDRAPELGRCLAALGGPQRVLVIDDGSKDAGAVAALCMRAGAELLRRDRPGGPAAARNAALPHVDSELIAFLDSDCVPTPGWLELLAGVLLDPSVGVVAPRIRPLVDGEPGGTASPGAGAVARFAAVRSPLDLGDRPGEVRPGGRIGYVPSAALVVRRSALGGGFDEALRYGEDVDLVWRLHDAGWRIRYEPAAVVGHAEPTRWRSLTARRFHYGTAAGPLTRRHPGRLAPAVVHPRAAAVIALAVTGAPGLTLVGAAVHLGVGAARMRRVGVPTGVAVEFGLRGLLDSAGAMGQAGTMLAPGVMIAGLARRRTRPLTLTLVLAQPLHSWARRSPRLDPVRFTLFSVADDVAYGMGVWTGSIRARTWRPLLPTLAHRTTGESSAKASEGPGAEPGIRSKDNHWRTPWLAV